jgi:multidrug efflux system outer membrane protein
MINRTCLKSVLVTVITASLLQSCAIPDIAVRESELTLPDQFSAANAQATDNVAIDWASWFEDPVLAELIDTALTNNQEAAILLQRINMAANEVTARQGEYLPSVGLGVDVETEKVGEFTHNGSVEEHLDIRENEAFPDPLPNLRAGLRASWELDVWRKLRNSAKAATLEYMASIEGRRFFITELVAEVSRSYFELLALDNQLDTLDQTLAIQRNALATSRELQNFGRTSTLPVARFEAEVSKNESERFLIQQDIIATENRINLLLGRTPRHIPRQAEILMRLEPGTPATGVPADLLANRPDIRRAELELEAAKLDIAVAKANFYPAFALKAGVGLEAFDARYLTETPASLLYSLSGEIMAPLVNRKAIAAQYRDASALQIQAAFEYEQTLVRAFTEVSTNLSRLDNLTQSYALKNRQVEALNESVEVANQLFASAREEYLEVLLAQREALEARSELIETRQQQMSALVDLYQALGGGWQSTDQ